MTPLLFLFDPRSPEQPFFFVHFPGNIPIAVGMVVDRFTSSFL